VKTETVKLNTSDFCTHEKTCLISDRVVTISHFPPSKRFRLKNSFIMRVLSVADYSIGAIGTCLGPGISRGPVTRGILRG